GGVGRGGQRGGGAGGAAGLRLPPAGRRACGRGRVAFGGDRRRAARPARASRVGRAAGRGGGGGRRERPEGRAGAAGVVRRVPGEGAAMSAVKFQGITPYLHYEDAAASLAWLARRFGCDGGARSVGGA